MRLLRRVLGSVVATVLGFVALAWWVLESGGVARIETTAADGRVRETHVWYVVRDGELWVEAGTPENSWFVDVQREPVVVFRSDELSGSYRARIDRDPAAHPRLRAALQDKYGLRDRFVGLLVDSSRSLAVQLHPESPARGDPE